MKKFNGRSIQKGFPGEGWSMHVKGRFGSPPKLKRIPSSKICYELCPLKTSLKADGLL